MGQLGVFSLALEQRQGVGTKRQGHAVPFAPSVSMPRYLDERAHGPHAAYATAWSQERNRSVLY